MTQTVVLGPIPSDESLRAAKAAMSGLVVDDKVELRAAVIAARLVDRAVAEAVANERLSMEVGLGYVAKDKAVMAVHRAGAEARQACNGRCLPALLARIDELNARVESQARTLAAYQDAGRR